MILMENIHGTTMMKFPVETMSEAKRLDVVARVIEADRRLVHAGLFYNNVSQSKVIIIDNKKYQDVVERVCLLDFSASKVYGVRGVADEYRQFTVLPPSPALRWWDTGILEFGNWLHDDLDYPGEFWRSWLTDKYADSTEFEPFILTAGGYPRHRCVGNKDVKKPPGNRRNLTGSSPVDMHLDSFQEPEKRWVPPPEPHKPYLPYKRGFMINIHPHTPVQPFGKGYVSYPGERREVRSSKLHETTLADLCHAHPPTDGITCRDKFRGLEFVDVLKVKDGGAAQIFVCRLDGEPKEYVAKVYDPLCYGFATLMWSDLPRDVTCVADGDYAREVAAYEYLDAQHFRCPEVPTYHGSWTFDLPTDSCYTDPRTGNHTRPVRMILIEHIDGRTMRDMNLARTPTEYRLSVMSRMMETDSRLRHIGLNHNDISQRNIMVCGYESMPEGPTRVCIIDFNIAVIAERSEDAVDKKLFLKKSPLPVSPVDGWWFRSGYADYEFGNWFPDDWDERAWHKWLLDKYGDSESFELPKGNLEEDGETSDLCADGTPYGDHCHTVQRFPSDSPLSELGRTRRLPDREREMSDFAHGSPKRIRSDFEDDAVDYELEKRHERMIAHNPDTRVKTDHWALDSDQPRLGHLSIGVKDYHTAKVFYSALRPLGLNQVYDSEAECPSSGTRILGYGPDKTQELLNIFEYGDEAKPPGRGCHIAFNAPSREAVDEFHEGALVYGGTCDGKPGLRPQYGPNYYAAFVISPDGWRLEAVCKNPQ